MQSPPKLLDQDFSSWYLRQVTSELAEDLEKVRQANDFKEDSLQMLVHALQQGEHIFTGEEKKRMIGGG